MPPIRVGVPDTQDTTDNTRQTTTPTLCKYDTSSRPSRVCRLSAPLRAHTPVPSSSATRPRDGPATPPSPHRQCIAPCRAQSRRLRTHRRGVLHHVHPQRAPPERTHPQERGAHRARHSPCQCHAPPTGHRRASDQLIRTWSGHPSGRQSWGRRSCNRDRRH